MRDLFDVDDVDPGEWPHLLELALETPPRRWLSGDGVALLFEKPSARTRNATEMAVVDLGGHPVYISGAEVGLDVRETAEDVARTLGCYHRVLCARVFDHALLARMAGALARRDFSVPLVNLLSDAAPPLPGRGRRAHDARGPRVAPGPGPGLRRRRQQRGAITGRGGGARGDGGADRRSGRLQLRLGGAFRLRGSGGARRMRRFGAPIRGPARRRPSRGRRSSTPTSGPLWARKKSRRCGASGAFDGVHHRPGPGAPGPLRTSSSCTVCPHIVVRRSPTTSSRVPIAGVASSGPPADRHARHPGLGARRVEVSGQTVKAADQAPAPAPITKLLETRPVASQAQLVVLLAEQGVEATQTTVSRDLDETWVRSRSVCPAGRRSYALPELPSQQIAPEDHLRRVLGRVGGRGGTLGQPGRAADPAGVGPRRRLRPRSQRCRGCGRDGRRRRHRARGGRRGGRRWHDGPAPARRLGDCRCTSDRDRMERK